METLEGFQATLVDGLSRECRALTRRLREEFDRREQALKNENKKLQAELASLRQRPFGSYHSTRLIELPQADPVSSSKQRKLPLNHNGESHATPKKSIEGQPDVIDLDNCSENHIAPHEAREHTKSTPPLPVEKTPQYAALAQAHLTLKRRYREDKKLLIDWEKYATSESNRKKRKQGDTSPEDILNDTSFTWTERAPVKAPPGITQISKIDKRPSDMIPKEGRLNQSTNNPSDAQDLFTLHDGRRHDQSKVSDEAIPEYSQSAELAQADLKTSNESRRGNISCSVVHNAPQCQVSVPLASRLEEEEDLPIVVSERSLKRKRNSRSDASAIRIHEDISHGPWCGEQVVAIKDENSSSSPIIASGPKHIQDIHDSLDLDEVGAPIMTPRKRRQWQELLARSQRAYVHRNRDHSERVGANPPSRIKQHRKAQRVTLEREVPEDVHGLENSKLARQRRHNYKAHLRQNNLSRDHTALPDIHRSSRIARRENGDYLRATSEPINEIFSQKQTPSERAVSKPSERIVLQSKPPNTVILPRTGNSKRSTLINRHYGGAADIPLLAEDGEVNEKFHHKRSGLNSALSRNRDQVEDRTSRVPEDSGRLDTLLAEPSPEKPVLLPALSHVSSDDHQPRNQNTSGPPCSKSTNNLVPTKPLASAPTTKHSLPPAPFETPRKSSPKARPHPSHPPSIAIPASTSPNRPPPQPLRSLPLERLTLDDFKINPNHNQGLDYAFSEVLRTRQARKCLPGCTRPSCCGTALRKAAEIGGSGLLDADDAEVLREFFAASSTTTEGTSIDAALTYYSTLSDAEKSEILTQARASRFARLYGRHHRQAYGRGQSPPGFWEVDMPDTQEARAFREEAGRLERERVEERWMEARGRGRWLFRDE
ncbi:hypothetical protein MMC20_004570 [Loxospora ochrophaea]|nr:hypothetical protein [Loxospora ochrophaea]